uniref:Uncharacterized protein n=1 Tax=Chlorella vulgaris TaxID=3077 RepID=V9H0Z1_CHLVU|nr:hypothetical protein ChvulCp138 [Chlorella vulgaris]pir/T07324/ hypothetical protein 42e - Chlorella vulgaris chloroplast [Chlorella vulgaris]BAA57972.1 unnamed protein product [Chlorella vulgaris]
MVYDLALCPKKSVISCLFVLHQSIAYFLEYHKSEILLILFYC